MELLRYEFGYGWLYNYGHLLAMALFAGLLFAAWRLEWSRWIVVVGALGMAWSISGLLIVQYVLRLNLPMSLPTESFLSEGRGTVLDGGAGSGRSSIMVLRDRPEAKVVALDLYGGYYGITNNGPERLMENARRAGVDDRLRAETGDLRAMTLASASLDGAVSAFVIDHIESAGRERAFLELHRVLRPDAQLLLMVVNPDGWIRAAWPFFMHHGYWGSRRGYERWRNEVTAAGFEVEEMGTIPGGLYVLARRPAETVEPAGADSFSE
jgi:SAM-dependent methyltransferase